MVLFRRILQWLYQNIKTAYRWLTKPPDELREAKDTQTPGQSELPLGNIEPPRYAKRQSLLTNPEDFLFGQLLSEIGPEYRVFAKVRLADVIYLRNLPVDRKYHNNQIQCKHFDFVLCHTKSLEPLLAIELNDDSHSYYNRILSDQFKQKVCDEIGLPFLLLWVGVKHPPGDLARQIQDKITSRVPPASTT